MIISLAPRALSSTLVQLFIYHHTYSYVITITVHVEPRLKEFLWCTITVMVLGLQTSFLLGADLPLLLLWLNLCLQNSQMILTLICFFFKMQIALGRVYLAFFHFLISMEFELGIIKSPNMNLNYSKQFYISLFLFTYIKTIDILFYIHSYLLWEYYSFNIFFYTISIPVCFLMMNHLMKV